MNIGERLISILSGIAGDQIYPGIAPESPTPPFVVYGHFGPLSFSHSGRSRLQNQRFQIDVYSLTYEEASGIADQIEAIMDLQNAYGSPPIFGSTQITRAYVGVDSEVRLHRFMLEFSTWFYP